MFIWTGENCISGKNVGLPNGLTSSDVEYLLESIIYGSAVSTPFSSILRNPKAEVVVIFLEPQLSSPLLPSYLAQLPSLTSLMKTSAGSLYAPFVDLSEPLDSVIIRSASSVDKNANVIYSGKGATLLPDLKARVPKVKSTSIANLQKTLSLSKIFSNGVTDLVIVHFENPESDTDDFTRSNEIIYAVSTLISDKTTNYIAVYTSLSSDAQVVDDSKFQKRLFLDYEELSFEEQASNNTNGTGNWFQNFFPGWFWAVALVLVFIIPIAITAFFQIMSIQTPNIEERSKKHK